MFYTIFGNPFLTTVPETDEEIAEANNELIEEDETNPLEE